MDREVLFEKFLEDCKNRKECCGQGNPNTDILIIGKEPYNDYFVSDEEEITKRLLEQENICRSGFGEAPRDSQKTTWCNYQMLIENYYGPQKVLVEFLERKRSNPQFIK